ncbi:MAG: hypothetical protein KAV42_01095, partial [Candidatus Krumholzibacteria bacterium]|nr:hypothetical protein [Candidatus Krumholzibacteria bacterium]
VRSLFDKGNVSGSITAIESDNGLIVAIDITSVPQVSIVMDFDKSISFEGISSPDNDGLEFDISGTRAKIIHKGHSHYKMTFRRSDGHDAPVDIRIFDGDTLIAERLIGKNQLSGPYDVSR